jgi:preprotein translocase subunit SecA
MATHTQLLPTDQLAQTPVEAVPSATWSMLSNQVRTEPLPKDIDAWFETIKGYMGRLRYRTGHYLARAKKVLANEKMYRDMSDAHLRDAVLEFRAMFRTGRDKSEDMLRAVAAIREVAARKRGERHFFVQVAGALAMLDGCITEMATGEGKTLTATLAATIAGWRGRGCHVITVNDYLAHRDAELMRCVYEFCGCTVASINSEDKPPIRRPAYACDITYLTNKEACADFLRDRIALGRLKDLPSALLGKMLYRAGTDRVVQRGLAFAIVDEADSVMIDEAVTPLIIAGDAPNPEQVEAFKQAADIAASLVKGKHYRADERFREVEITDEGFNTIMDMSENFGGVWNGSRRAEELVNQALTAREFYVKEKQYVIAAGLGELREGEDPKQERIVIVDEFTGRLMPDRTWRDGLHQALEAKENLVVNPPKDTYNRISFQRFFRMYHRLCGMTGTAVNARRELWQIFKLPVVVIPTNKPCIRTVPPDLIFANEDAKFAGIVQEIQRLHARGQPILVGTRSIKVSERLSDLLNTLGLKHETLNAKYHAQEAEIVARAGTRGCITVATNMAGRGTDIKLARGVAELGGLCVIATERHESRRVDRQLFGRSARQGDPGRAQAFLSLEDELVVHSAPRLMPLAKLLAGKTAAPLRNPYFRFIFWWAQQKAQHGALTQRKGVLSTDDWLDESLGFAGAEL